jgi:hypothetical protein
MMLWRVACEHQDREPGLDGMLNAIKHRLAFDPPKKTVVPVIETAQRQGSKAFPQKLPVVRVQ